MLEKYFDLSTLSSYWNGKMYLSKDDHQYIGASKSTDFNTAIVIDRVHGKELQQLAELFELL
jgi:hypothetical protein